MHDFLKRIELYKRAEIEAAKSARPAAELAAAARDASPPRGFLQALEQKRSTNTFALIAELKRASPSQGLVRRDFAPKLLAAAYEQGGAACLSVLTDQPSFQGSAADLMNARCAVTIPVLRKDFLFDSYQVLEARCWGADCILIILAAVTDATAKRLLDASKALGMDALIEVHDEEELDRALALDPTFIGINNRDLHTFRVDLGLSHRLARQVTAQTHLVCESGIAVHDDMLEVSSRSEIRTFLVGESLMRQENLALATSRLLIGTG